MRPCHEMETLLYDRAAGALGPEETPRLEEHLDACPACRAELARVEEALALARVPPFDPPAPRAQPDLASSTLALFRRGRQRRVTVAALAAGALAAAAAGTLALAPALYSPSRRPAEPAPAAAPAWSPDVDGALAASSLASGDGSEEDATIVDAALDGLDAADR
jgi:anti-sigma factor RsiW